MFGIFIKGITTLAQSQSNYKLRRSELEILWEVWVKDPIIPHDQAVFYELLKEIVSYGNIKEHIISMDEALSFFTEVLCDEKNNFASLSMEGMQAIEAFLVGINKFLGGLSEADVSSGPRLYPILVEQHPHEDLNFKVKVNPSEIKGLNILWKVALEAKNDNVTVLAIDVLNKLHTVLEPHLEERIAEISTHFIETAIEKLGVFYEGMVARKENRAKEIVKLLKLVEEMIDESERKGNAGYTPLYALHKFRPVNLKVVDNSTARVISTDPRPQWEATVSSSLTCWQLKMLIARRFNLPPDSVQSPSLTPSKTSSSPPPH